MAIFNFVVNQFPAYVGFKLSDNILILIGNIGKELSNVVAGWLNKAKMNVVISWR